MPIKVFASSDGYDLAADNYDKKEKYLNGFEKGRFLPMIENWRDKKVLDVGAGTGRVAIALQKLGAKVTALDISPKILKVLQKKEPRIKIVCADAESLPFGDDSFDVVTAAFLIVHLKNPQRFFAEAYRVLKDGGYLLFTNINQKEPPEIKTDRGLIKIESYYHRPEKIREILNDLAFQVIEEEIIKEKDIWINQIILAKK